MFAQQLNPSLEGKMDRFAPIAVAFALAVMFVLSLMVTVAAVNTSETLMARARIESVTKKKAPTALVKCDASNAAICG